MLDAPMLPRPHTAPAPAARRAESGTLGRMGGLVARLARSDAEVEAAQRLRHRVFVRECGASREGREDGRERDALDAACDHLLVLDGTRIVGTYRLLRCEVAARAGGHYSAAEFHLGPMLAHHPRRRFLELGRSCTLPAYRTRRTIELLWQGVWAYALAHRLDVMFGCASLPGLDPEAHKGVFGFLARHAAAPSEWTARGRDPVAALPDFADEAAHPREALAALPPLVKGYLRLGGRVGPDVVADPDFHCLDLMMVLPRESIAPRYLAHYGADARRFA